MILRALLLYHSRALRYLLVRAWIHFNRFGIVVLLIKHHHHQRPSQMSKPVPNRKESDVYDRQIRLWGAEAQVCRTTPPRDWLRARLMLAMSFVGVGGGPWLGRGTMALPYLLFDLTTVCFIVFYRPKWPRAKSFTFMSLDCRPRL
jgi:hypothetical protein